MSETSSIAQTELINFYKMDYRWTKNTSDSLHWGVHLITFKIPVFLVALVESIVEFTKLIFKFVGIIKPPKETSLTQKEVTPITISAFSDQEPNYAKDEIIPLDQEQLQPEGDSTSAVSENPVPVQEGSSQSQRAEDEVITHLDLSEETHVEKKEESIFSNNSKKYLLVGAGLFVVTGLVYTVNKLFFSSSEIDQDSPEVFVNDTAGTMNDAIAGGVQQEFEDFAALGKYFQSTARNITLNLSKSCCNAYDFIGPQTEECSQKKFNFITNFQEFMQDTVSSGSEYLSNTCSSVIDFVSSQDKEFFPSMPDGEKGITDLSDRIISQEDVLVLRKDRKILGKILSMLPLLMTTGGLVWFNIKNSLSSNSRTKKSNDQNTENFKVVVESIGEEFEVPIQILQSPSLDEELTVSVQTVQSPPFPKKKWFKLPSMKGGLDRWEEKLLSEFMRHNLESDIENNEKADDHLNPCQLKVEVQKVEGNSSKTSWLSYVPSILGALNQWGSDQVSKYRKYGSNTDMEGTPNF